MTMNFKTMIAAGAVAFCAVTGANAATVTFGTLPAAAEANPFADDITGTVFENYVGSVNGVRRSPWQNSSVDEDAVDSFYTSVSGNSSATYNFDEDMGSISFVWGSPDTYNDLDIILSSGTETVTINGAQAFGTPGLLAEYVTITDVGAFDSVTFRSGSNAFEFANLSTTVVPLPAALPLLLVGVAGLGMVGRRRRNKA